jgi:hypothetical protein
MASTRSRMFIVGRWLGTVLVLVLVVAAVAACCEAMEECHRLRTAAAPGTKNGGGCFSGEDRWSLVEVPRDPETARVPPPNRASASIVGVLVHRFWPNAAAEAAPRASPRCIVVDSNLHAVFKLRIDCIFVIAKADTSSGN